MWVEWLFIVCESVFIVDRFGRWGEVWGATEAHVQDLDNVQWRPHLQWVYTTPTSVVAAACTSLICSVTRRFLEKGDTLTVGTLTPLNHDCFVVVSITQRVSQREETRWQLVLWHFWIMIALLYRSPKDVPRENRHVDTWRFDTFKSWLLCCISHPRMFPERIDTLTLGALTLLNHDCFVVSITQRDSQRGDRLTLGALTFLNHDCFFV